KNRTAMPSAAGMDERRFFMRGFLVNLPKRPRKHADSEGNCAVSGHFARAQQCSSDAAATRTGKSLNSTRQAETGEIASYSHSHGHYQVFFVEISLAAR